MLSDIFQQPDKNSSIWQGMYHLDERCRLKWTQHNIGDPTIIITRVIIRPWDNIGFTQNGSEALFDNFAHYNRDRVIQFCPPPATYTDIVIDQTLKLATLRPHWLWRASVVVFSLLLGFLCIRKHVNWKHNQSERTTDSESSCKTKRTNVQRKPDNRELASPC